MNQASDNAQAAMQVPLLGAPVADATPEQTGELFHQATINLAMNDQGLYVECAFSNGTPVGQVLGWVRREVSDEPGEEGTRSWSFGPEQPADDGLGAWAPFQALPVSGPMDEKNVAHVLAWFISNNVNSLIPAACAQYLAMRGQALSKIREASANDAPRIITGASEICGG